MQASDQYWEAVKGRIVNNGEPVEGVRVRAMDKDVISDDFLGEAVTGADGTFRIDFPQSAYQSFVSLGEGRPDVYLKLSHPELGSKKTQVQYELSGDLEKTDDPEKGGLDMAIEVMDLGDITFPE